MHEPDFLDILRQFLADCQSGFFFYTLVYFGLRLSKGKQKLREFDRCATLVICGVSLLLLIVWTGEVVYGWNVSHENRVSMYRRMTGKYAFGFWLPPIFYTLLPQLLWMRKLRENYLSRFAIALLVFFNFEKFVILVTSLHRDYLPGSWTPYSDSFLPHLLLGLLWKLALFAGLTSFLYAMRAKKDNFAE